MRVAAKAVDPVSPNVILSPDCRLYRELMLVSEMVKLKSTRFAPLKGRLSINVATPALFLKMPIPGVLARISACRPVPYRNVKPTA